MVYDKGNNDMSYGWTRANEKNCRIYETWTNMLARCYSEKYHERFPTYVECSVCKRWLLLSNFVEDLKNIDGYDETKFLNGDISLDKDIKSNGENKEYSLENCMWVSIAENARQAMKTRNYLQGENNPRSIKIVQYDKQGNLIKIWGSSHEIERLTGINCGRVIYCCKWYECGENKEKWYETHKNHPYKSAGGFIWKYYKEIE